MPGQRTRSSIAGHVKSVLPHQLDIVAPRVSLGEIAAHRLREAILNDELPPRSDLRRRLTEQEAAQLDFLLT